MLAKNSRGYCFNETRKTSGPNCWSRRFVTAGFPSNGCHVKGWTESPRKTTRALSLLHLPSLSSELEELVQQGFESGKRVMIVVLDGVTDVGNLGAIARSAECFGATGLVVQDHHAAPVNEDAVKTSSGALLRLPVARVSDVTKALRYMGKCGLERIGLSEKADLNITACERSDAACLVLGDEELGISTTSWAFCDVTRDHPYEREHRFAQRERRCRHRTAPPSRLTVPFGLQVFPTNGAVHPVKFDKNSMN